MERAPAPDLGLVDIGPLWALLPTLADNKSGMTKSITLPNNRLR